MTKKTDAPDEDPNLAVFRAILAKKKAAQTASSGPKTAGSEKIHQKPRPKERIRRRP